MKILLLLSFQNSNILNIYKAFILKLYLFKEVVIFYFNFHFTQSGQQKYLFNTLEEGRAFISLIALSTPTPGTPLGK